MALEIQTCLGWVQRRGESSPATAMAWSPTILACQPKMPPPSAHPILLQHCQGQEMPRTMGATSSTQPCSHPALLTPSPAALSWWG